MIFKKGNLLRGQNSRTVDYSQGRVLGSVQERSSEQKGIGCDSICIGEDGSDVRKDEEDNLGAVR